jgi:serine/threonine protein phosphatase PrpC
MKFTLVQDSRIGARQYQQDRIGHWSTRTSLLLAVADGMGGHEHGEVAAQVAIDHLAVEFRRDAKPRLTNPDVFLFRSLGRAHAAIQLEAQRLRLPEAPATVIVACVVQDGYAYWNHVGDSRLYLIRNGRIVARTKDHSRVQQLVDEGRIREEAIPSHPDRNKLLQCLGGVQPPKIEPASSARLAKNDVLLLCSDGLWGPLTQRQILGAFLSKDLKGAIENLASLAVTRAGVECDNVSALAILWGEDEVAPITEPQTLPAHDLPTKPQDLGSAETEYLRMSDEDIERAIAEIRATVAKNKPRNET